VVVGVATMTGSVAGANPAGASSPDAVVAGDAQVAAAALVASRPGALHAGPDDGFVQRPVLSSLGWQYVPYERTYRGLPVIGGDFVVVVDPAGQVSSTSVAQEQAIKGVDTTPKLSRAAAEKVASGRLKSAARVEGSRLVVYALGASPRLAWESAVDGTGAEGISELTVEVDAITGAVLDTREGVMQGTASSGYNGPVEIATTKFSPIAGTVYAMADPRIVNLDCRDYATGETFSKSVDTWGNGDPSNRETACADALFATQTETRMLSSWLGRNGLNGSGGAWPIRVGYDDTNAYYDPGNPQVVIGHNADESC
jgi:zinc metalloprotease ZmpA